MGKKQHNGNGTINRYGISYSFSTNFFGNELFSFLVQLYDNCPDDPEIRVVTTGCNLMPKGRYVRGIGNITYELTPKTHGHLTSFIELAVSAQNNMLRKRMPKRKRTEEPIKINQKEQLTPEALKTITKSFLNP